MLEVITDGGASIGIRLQGRQFVAEDESGEIVVPKKFLVGFALSEIPRDLVIKPVEKIEGGVVHINDDISIGGLHDGSACAYVEDMGCRKLWDGDVGFGKFMDAMRQAIDERHQVVGDVGEIDFQDDGDYIFLHYEVRLSEDMQIEATIQHVEAVIAKLEERRDRILQRRLDPLLGILDRTTFDVDLTNAVETAEVTHGSVALILADIDHFKLINDTHGHPVGDLVLQQLAQILAAKAKGVGVAYRYGGEELAVLLLSAAAANALEVAEAFRNAVQRSHPEPNITVTVSCGVAYYPAHARDSAELIKAADRALYGAKEGGRNRVVVADS